MSSEDLQNQYVRNLRSLFASATNAVGHTVIGIASHGLTLITAGISARCLHVRLQKLRLIRDTLVSRNHPVPNAHVKDLVIGMMIGGAGCAAGVAASVPDGLADHICQHLSTLIENAFSSNFDVTTAISSYPQFTPQIGLIPSGYYDPSAFAPNALYCTPPVYPSVPFAQASPSPFYEQTTAINSLATSTVGYAVNNLISSTGLRLFGASSMGKYNGVRRGHGSGYRY